MSGRDERDDEAPLFLVPRFPGTAIAAGIGALLVLLAGVSAYMSWRAGTLDLDALSPSDTEAGSATGPAASRPEDDPGG